MKTNLPDNDELSDSYHLRSLSRKEPFHAPNGYFNTLTSQIQDKINQDRNILTSDVKTKRPVYIFVTMITICLSAFIFFIMITSKPKTQDIACTYDDVIESGYYSELDENALSEKYIACTPLNTNNDQAIEDYLINNSDESLLTNQF